MVGSSQSPVFHGPGLHMLLGRRASLVSMATDDVARVTAVISADLHFPLAESPPLTELEAGASCICLWRALIVH